MNRKSTPKIQKTLNWHNRKRFCNVERYHQVFHTVSRDVAALQMGVFTKGCHIELTGCATRKYLSLRDAESQCERSVVTYPRSFVMRSPLEVKKPSWCWNSRQVRQRVDMQEVNEARTFRVLPKFPSGIDLKHLTSVSTTTGGHHGRITAWSEVVKWLLRSFVKWLLLSFATNEALGGSVTVLGGVNQHPSEDETEFYIRLTEANNRCGNVNTMDKQMKMFVEGSNTNHRTILSQYSQNKPEAPF